MIGSDLMDVILNMVHSTLKMIKSGIKLIKAIVDIGFHERQPMK